MSTDSAPAVSAAIPKPRLGWLWDHNPFYVLSGTAMLLGCYLIASAVHGQEGRVWPLIALLGVFNVYEIAVLALGLLLARRRLAPDAKMLLVLAVVLLSDVTLVCNELSTVSLHLGAAACLGAAVLAAAKLGVIAWGLRLRLTGYAWTVVAAALIMLYGLPGLCRLLSGHALLGPAAMYGLWWLAGAVVAAQSLPARWLVARGDAPGTSAAVAGAFEGAVRIVLPLAAIGHLLAIHRMYWAAQWCVADLSPLILGAGLMMLLRPPAWLNAAWQRRLALIAVATAVALSIDFPKALMLTLPGGLVLSPWRVALVAGGLCLGLAAWRLKRVELWIGGAAALAIAALGHRPEVMFRRVASAGSTAQHALDWILPRTTLQWGIAAVGAAFALLLLGAVRSWRHGRT